MNILQVVPELNAGGVERTTIEIADALSAAGHVPHVVSLGGRMEDELKAAGGVLHRLRVGSKNPMSLRRNTKALIDIIKTHKIDIVHVRSRAPAWPAKAAAKATGTPFITTYHGIYNARSGLKRRYNAVMAKGDVVIANSNFTKDHIIREHNINGGKIVAIPRGVDMDIFDPAQVTDANVTQIKLDWGVGNSPIILLPGRLTRWKGQLVAVEALKLLENHGINAVLVLLGDAQGRNDYVADIKTKAEALNISERVIFAGHSRAMPAALMAADVVISPSTDPEAFGRVMAEAQAMQRLVVASGHGGALETIVDGAGGNLVTPGDAQALADGIANILSLSKSAYTKRAKAARIRIGLQYSAQALKTATLEVYEHILRKQGRN
ncbi:MAG: glycosyltransferase family 4 protein [Robiginitomaculum sp.]|nr:glycosyltransferase family 4 protein [Robiginitomaculum sp.]